MIHINAKNHRFFRWSKATQQARQMVYHGRGTVGQGNLALKLGGAIQITQQGPFRNVDIGPLFQRLFHL